MVTATVNCTPRRTWKASTTGPGARRARDLGVPVRDAGGVRCAQAPQDLCLEDAWLSRGGTAHRRAPSQGGRAFGGPAPRTDRRSQHKGVTTALGGFASAAGLCTRPGEIAHGGIVDLGDIDGGEITWAGPAGEWHRLLAVGFDTGAGLPRAPGGTTTQLSSPCWVRYRSRQSPQGPASSTTMRGVACDGIVRIE